MTRSALGSALALALVPVLRSWELTRDVDTAATTLALFLGAAWQISGYIPANPPSRTARIAVWTALALAAWQTAWIGVDDFWEFRAALIVWPVCWLLLLAGPRALSAGWRIVAAFALWALCCDGPWKWARDSYQAGNHFAQSLAVATAHAAGWLLWQFGAPVAVHGNVLQIGGQAVSVGTVCTALPLAKLLLVLLVMAAWLLRLPLSRLAGLIAVAGAVSFVTSVVRVIILAYTVQDKERFHFWHDADKGGTGWFTSAAMLLLAVLVARGVARGLSAAPPTLGGTFRPPLSGRWIALASVAAIAAARATALSPRFDYTVVAPSAAFRMVADSTWIASIRPDRAEANQPVWYRRIEYQGPAETYRCNIVLAYVPRMLNGDPLGIPALAALAPGAIWAATVVPGDGPFFSRKAWLAHFRSAYAKPTRWLSWILHRRPLTDKRAFWLAATWNGSASQRPERPPAIFSSWLTACSILP